MQWYLIILAALGVLFYQRASLLVFTLASAILLGFLTRFETLSTLSLVTLWTLFLLIAIPLNILPWRRKWLSQPLLKFYLKVMPSMSRTEKEALMAGSVTWEGDLFRGMPKWNKLLALPKPSLTPEEQAFIDGPVNTLCSMIDDWDITHNRADLPPDIWQFIREQGFFGLIIPKEYGGKGFSAFAHSQILIRIYGFSVTVATTVSVPNSLGPGELLMHYGTPEQKSYYLPRLSRGEEIPCFALTGPNAGSDAGAIPDAGVVCWGEHEGKKTLGIRLNFNKRYITLAPVATVIGLAFKLYDPDHLIGDIEALGITCALIPRNTPNVKIGRRHSPIGTPFQNGPIHGTDVFIPVDWIIGGATMAGQGWRMLMECLATGRAISLPSSSTGGTKALSYTTGAYATIRRQFNTSIGRFEGIEEALARIACNTYIIDAARSFTAASIDAGEKPAIASAIIKYHTTELGRATAIDAMDIHGGKAICSGPKNYIGRGYLSSPIAITVEGANILTRNMIIFGQGAMRCHPYIYSELEAAQRSDEKERLVAFDKAIMGHAGYTVSNFVRSVVLGITSGLLVIAPKGKSKRYFQQATRFSAAFALISDISLLTLGGALKRKESISARLGDVLSYLYLMSAVLKQFYDHGQPVEDMPLIRWSCQMYLFNIQQKLDELLQNFPNRWVARLLRVFIFPLGKNFAKPHDKLTHQVAKLLLTPTATRTRLVEGMCLDPMPGNVLASVNMALIKVLAAEPIEKIIKTAVHDKLIQGSHIVEQAKAAFKQHIISQEQCDVVLEAEVARQNIIAVDDFAPEELARSLLQINMNHNDTIRAYDHK
jgi:acyl-CoA dehydrogenase